MFNKLNVLYTFRRADKQQARKTISNEIISRKNKHYQDKLYFSLL